PAALAGDLALLLLVHRRETAAAARTPAALAAPLSAAATAARRPAALAAGLAGFLAVELMRGAAFVGRPAALAGDLALLLRVHRGEPTLTVVADHGASSFTETGNEGAPPPPAKGRGRSAIGAHAPIRRDGVTHRERFRCV